MIAQILEATQSGINADIVRCEECDDNTRKDSRAEC